MRRGRGSRLLAAAVAAMLAGVLLGCDGTDRRAEAAAAIAAAVADPGRPEEDRRRDADRKPAEVLEFFGIEPGMHVAELQAATGYYVELLSSVVGPKGKVWAQNNSFVLERFAAGPLTERLARLGRDNIERLDLELNGLRLPDDLDAVLLIRFYHDLFWLPDPQGRIDRGALNRVVFDALEPGGIYAVLDHHAEPGSGDRDAVDPREGLHRIDADLVKDEILDAGFILDAESDLLHDPGDTLDWNIFIDDGTRRDTTSRFIYRFRKP